MERLPVTAGDCKRRANGSPRRSIRRWAVTLLLGGALISALAACGSDDDSGDGGVLASAQDKGTIVVGVANEKPFGYLEGNQVKGFVPDLGGAILKNLGVANMKGVVTQFDGLIPGLQAKRYDMIAAGMSVTIDRCKAALFSNPFFTIPGQMAVKKGNPLGLENIEDVASKDARLGVLAGSIALTGAKASGVDNVQTYPDVPAGLDALRAGRIDAFADGTVTIAPSVAQDSSLGTSKPFFIVLDGKKVVASGAFVFRKGDEELVQKFNAELKKMLDDGSVLELAKPYGLGPAEINSAKAFTADQLCKTVDL